VKPAALFHRKNVHNMYQIRLGTYYGYCALCNLIDQPVMSCPKKIKIF